MSVAIGQRPNDRAERRARRRLGLALYLSRVPSSDLLGAYPGDLNDNLFRQLAKCWRHQYDFVIFRYRRGRNNLIYCEATYPVNAESLNINAGDVSAPGSASAKRIDARS